MRKGGILKYAEFMLVLIGSVIGKKRWENYMTSVAFGSTTETFSTFVTASDEAFVLFALENSWNKFMRDERVVDKKDWEFTKEEDDTYRDYLQARTIVVQGKKGRVLIPNKYSGDVKKIVGGTRVGVKTQGINGWTDEGKQRFNALLHDVKEDRRGYGKDFDAKMNALIKQLLENRGNKRRKVHNAQPRTEGRVVVDDDFSDEE